ncbi:Per33p [Saccharomyces cerevisiae YJM1342]|nr:Per33p [Saccharomyces cerevisiae YJM1342]CAI4630525.1 BAP_1a_G0035590.mRNA.1.CDS.1 [Saccharomyces cerevisiae]CAI7226666.1 BAP_1a_G0035590.mRNA.1.CDS.1 [Saccharomyces cerevisiae]
MTVPRNRPMAPFGTIIKSRIKQPQFYWFIGHFLTIFNFIQFHLSITSKQNQLSCYKRSLFYISVTYAIVLYQFFKSDQLKFNFTLLRQEMKKLDNLQYFAMLFILFLLSQFNIIISGSLYSPVIFSIFHFLNYFKENLLPFLPLIPLNLKNLLNSKITVFIQNYNGFFLQMAQVFEIICGLRVGLFLVPFNFFLLLVRRANVSFEVVGTMLAGLTYVWFFKLRYLQSESMRQIFKQYVLRLDAYVSRTLPPYCSRLWNGYKNFVMTVFWKIPV